MSINHRLIKGIIILFCLLPSLVLAQSMRTIKPMADYSPPIIVCYANAENMNTKVPYEARNKANSRTTETTSAVFSVTYINFTGEQRAAFQFAIDIWAGLLDSDVTINIQATMAPLGEGVLGAAGPAARFGNFDNAQKFNTFYAVAMAEKMAGHDLNEPGAPDITITFNNEFSGWYYGTTGNPPSNTYDYVTVILHEIGHGLGFVDGTAESGGIGTYSSLGAPMVYDRYLETFDNQNLVDSFEDNSTELGAVLTSDSVFFKSFLFAPADRPQLHAPSPFNPGSSIAHLDEAIYPAGDPNSLMSPQVGATEVIHDPGLALKMLKDMGYFSLNIKFDKLLDSEDSISSRTLTLTASGDDNVIADGVTLHYSYDNFATETAEVMAETGNANEYTSVIPSTGDGEVVSYFVDVDGVSGRNFTSPGEAPEFFWQYVLAADTIAPTITHPSLKDIVFLEDPVVSLQAEVTDNQGVGDLMLSYKINGGAITAVIVPLISSTTDGSFEGEYLLDWDLLTLGVVSGDILEYRLEIEDLATTPNITMNPETGFNSVLIEEIGEPIVEYTNDFNSPTTDFTGTGFKIGSETGFDSDALHSDHPYRIEDGITGEDDDVELLHMLKLPIVFSDKDASISFDEVVLVEPGTDGTVFGDPNFFDYVVVEGSLDLGKSWNPVADGYDSRSDTTWLEKWSEDVVDQNSKSVGDLSLFRKRQIDMVANGNFAAGDTVLIRFKVYADQLAHGWGWVIDNLKVQIDEKPPSINQITPDYLLVGATELELKSKIEDNTELDSVIYEVDFNGNIQLLSLPGTTSQFTVNLTFPGITASDVFKYRIIAVDKAPIPNTSISPAVGFYEVPVANLGETKTIYTNDFNTESNDFIGGNFSIVTPPNFSDPAMVSTSPYPDAPFGITEMLYLLKYPIKLNQNSALVEYDEGVLTEPDVDKVSFDVSKDNGATWIAVFEPYDASEETLWSNIYSFVDEEGNSTGVPIPEMITSRFFNILDNPEVNGGDEVLVRFRLSVNDINHGWGWMVDNLKIQDPTTGIEDELNANILVYPNPSNTGSIIIEAELSGPNSQTQITDVLGKVVLYKESRIVNNTIKEKLDVSHLRKGLYIISIKDNTGVYTARVVIE